MRESPNVIITGTPGVGKTVHCGQLAQETGLRHLSINRIAKEHDCFESFDQKLESWVVDEDKVFIYLLIFGLNIVLCLTGFRFRFSFRE